MCPRYWTRVVKSFRGQLIMALLVISVLPLIVIQGVSFYQVQSIMQDNTGELIEANMSSTLRGVALTLNAYESVLNQLYTDDDLVTLIDKLNDNQDVALNSNQLIRALRAACYAKEHIQGITVILRNGDMVFYDKLTGSTIRNAWMEQGGVDPAQLYDQASVDNRLHLLPTQFAAQVGAQRVSLFHMARRVIDHKSIEKRLGVIVLSIDERLLGEALSVDRGSVGMNVLLDGDGRVISCPTESFIGHQMISPLDDCVQLAAHSGAMSSAALRAYAWTDEALGWQLVSVVDQGMMLRRIQRQQQLQLAMLLAAFLVLALVITLVTGRLSASVKKVASAMRHAGSGDMRARVAPDRRMAVEVAAIADQFNLMMGDIDRLIEQVKSASRKQRDAEITMLEAQINPHFLYNTLDTINWMAIDANQMDISGAITSLARILRYSIDRSNQRVTVREEAEWLDHYLKLQQMRLKNAFVYTLSVTPDALDKRIHKLLFQPFVENAILHGLTGVERERRLSIHIDCLKAALRIQIEDNGRGMEASRLAAIRCAGERREDQPGHIGILNAISRLRLYYGDSVHVEIDSEPDRGTKILIQLPLDKEEEAGACES